MSTYALLAHGSPDPRQGRSARRIAKLLTARGLRTHVAFLDHDEPRLQEVPGDDELIVLPLLLTVAYHARIDVPQAADRVRVVRGRRVTVLPPLGCGDDILRMAFDLPTDGGLVVAAAGTTDDESRSSIVTAVRAYGERLGVVATAGFSSAGGPTIGAALAEVESATGAPAALAPLVVFPGVFADRIARQGGARRLGRPLAEVPAFLDVLVDRLAVAA